MNRIFRVYEAAFEGANGVLERKIPPYFSSGTELFYHKRQSSEVYAVNFLETSLCDDEREEEIVACVERAVKRSLQKYKICKKDLVLVIGVGNEGLTADALGAKTLEHLVVTEHLHEGKERLRGRGRLAGFGAGVSGVTGISSFKVIKALIKATSPSLIIAIDTLCCKDVNRLNRTIQISTAGLTPGAGVGNAQISLNNKTLGIPVLAIGVPLVIYMQDVIGKFLAKNNHIASTENSKNFSLSEFNGVLVTSKEIDIIVNKTARIIAKGINLAVHGH